MAFASADCASPSTRETSPGETEGVTVEEGEDSKSAEMSSASRPTFGPSGPPISRSSSLIRMKDATFDKVLISAAVNGSEYDSRYVITDDLIHEKVFGFTEKTNLWFKPKIFVSELRQYQLTLKYRVLTESSLGFFAVRCFNKEGGELNGCDVCRHGSPAIINGISEDNTVIVCDRGLTGWFSCPVSTDDSQSSSDGVPCQKRSLALFFGGLESSQSKADLIIRDHKDWGVVDPLKGTYSRVESNRIYLNEKGAAILSRHRSSIIMGSTIIRNVSQGRVGWWLYPCKHEMSAHLRQGTDDDGGWITTSTTLSCVKGVDFMRDASEFDQTTLFRPGTYYIQLGYSHRTGNVNIDKIVFEITSD